MTDCNKVIKDIEYAKDLLQNRQLSLISKKERPT